MLETIFTTLVPVAFVVLLGYLAGRRNFFQIADRALMTKLVLNSLLPPLLLAGILQTPLRIPQVVIDSLNLKGGPTTGLSLFVVGLIIAEAINGKAVILSNSTIR